VIHPEGEGIRVDTAIADGLDVSIDYDPMLAKIIAHGADRDEARRRLVRALDETAVFGFPTNVEFVRALLELPEVVAGDLDTDLIARRFDDLAFAEADERVFAEAALLLDAARDAEAETVSSPWSRRDGWRLGAPAPRRYALVCGERRAEVLVTGSGSALSVAIDGSAPVPAARRREEASGRTLTIDGVTRTIAAFGTGSERVALAHRGAVFEVALDRISHAAGGAAETQPHLDSPMPGTVVLVHAADGARVEEGDPVLVVEAMKMEHVLRAGVAGTVSLHAAQGDTVARGQTLATITPDAGEAGSDQPAADAPGEPQETT